MADWQGEPKRGFRARLGNVLRPSKSRNTLRKNSSSTLSQHDPPPLRSQSSEAPPVPTIAPLQAHREKYREKWQQIDTQRGEQRDHTELLHALGRFDPFDSDESSLKDELDSRPPGDRIVASLSPELWDLIVSYLTPLEAGHLAIANRTLYTRLGRAPWDVLDRPENWTQKIEFLIRFDRQLPDHLLCFPCAQYHLRTRIGNERPRPAHVLNPLFNCPNAQNAGRPAPKTRITPARNLHFMFVQLVLRAHKFTPRHGIDIDRLAKRWRRDGWSYQTQYYVHQNHLLMRVVSSVFASANLTAAGMRLLLYSRDDYWPYFSVCAHWKQGELMHVCKCALSHIPDSDEHRGVEARLRDELAGRSYSATPIVTLCSNCRPMRRCPECPTEYLAEVKLTEDNSIRGRIAFRYTLIVTRWSDLGDGSSPLSPEWAACDGDGPYDSFAAVGQRTIAGIFESAFARDAIPGHRVLSLNPRNKTLRQAGEGWY